MDTQSQLMTNKTETTQSTKFFGAMIISLLLIFIAVASLTAYQFQKASIATHSQLMGKAINLVMDEKLEGIRQHALLISNAIKTNKKFKPAFKQSLNNNESKLASLFQDQFRQRLVTSDEVKILNINSYDKNFNLIHATFLNDQVIRATKEPLLITNIKKRTSTKRYKTVSVFWWTDQKKLVYSTFLTVGGLRLQGYIEVILDPIHVLKQIEGIMGSGLSLKSANNDLLFQSKHWSTLLENPDLIQMQYPAISQNGQVLISLAIFEDFSNVSDLVVRSLILATLVLLVVGGLAIFFSTYLIRSSELSTMKSSALSAKKANDAKARFLASMSHEIRTPINSIVGFTHLLQKSSLSVQQKESLNRIETASESLRSLVDNILDFSKIDAGIMVLEKVNFSPMKALKSVSSVLIFACEEKNIDFLVNMKGKIPEQVRGDSARFKQVMMNLCNNAVKFTEAGHILVTLEWQEQSASSGILSVSVQDTGLGIDDENLSSIFNLFSQGGTTSTREMVGAGLGLSISNQLVHLMGGQISLTSELGIGSIFSFKIPMSYDQKFGANSIMQGNDERVLVIESSKANADFLIDTLRLSNYNGVSHTSNTSALTLIKNKDCPPFNLVVVDWKPSQQSCIEILNYLHEFQASTPVMLLMRSSQAIEIELFKAMSIKAFLKKPIFNIEFLECAKDVLAGKNLLAKAEINSNKIHKSYQGKSCLVIDDNEANIELMSQLIKSYDIEVTTAINGKVGIDRIQDLLKTKTKPLFDIIFMDMMMPVMDGYECIEHIRNHDEMKDAFIVSLTANATTHEREKCLSAGANFFFTKPINVKALESLFIEQFGQPTISANKSNESTEETLRSLPAKLPGIDISGALELLGGRENIFLTVISAFIFEYGDIEKIESQLNTFLAEKKDTEAQRMAHTIKGVAGSVGATELQDAALQLELAMHDGKHLDEKLTLLWDHLSVTLCSCERINNMVKDQAA